jgi:hypothetical protein
MNPRLKNTFRQALHEYRIPEWDWTLSVLAAREDVRTARVIHLPSAIKRRFAGEGKPSPAAILGRAKSILRDENRRLR